MSSMLTSLAECWRSTRSRVFTRNRKTYDEAGVSRSVSRPKKMKIIIVHGGAASVAPEILQAKLADLRKAAKTGYQAMQHRAETREIATDAALNAVEKSIEVMENSPYFNAGFGSSLTSEGKVENDAIMTEGSGLNFGAVCSVTRIQNPIVLARSILEKSEHCVFSSEGAHRYAKDHGFKLIDNASLINQLAKDRLAEYKTFNNAILVDHDDATTEAKSKTKSSSKTALAGKPTADHDTVGAVAINNGVTGAGTSTGGITGKQPGRVGDTPIIGSGAYADDRLGCVSTTGHGEAIMKVCLARDVLARYEKFLKMGTREPMQAAVDDALDNMKDRVQGYGGIIAIGVSGHIGIGFSTRHMPWAYVCHKEAKQDYFTLVDNEMTSQPIEIHYGYERGDHFIVHE